METSYRSTHKIVGTIEGPVTVPPETYEQVKANYKEWQKRQQDKGRPSPTHWGAKYKLLDEFVKSKFMTSKPEEARQLIYNRLVNIKTAEGQPPAMTQTAWENLVGRLGF